TTEELTAGLRHHLRNKFTAIRNCAFYLRQKVAGTPLANEDPRINHFFQLIESQLEAANESLAQPAYPVRGLATRQPIDAFGVVERLVASLDPAGAAAVRLEGEGPLWVTIAEAELELAIFCMLQHGLDRSTEGVLLRCSTPPPADHIVFE